MTKLDSLFYELELKSKDWESGLASAQASAERFGKFVVDHPMAVAGAFAAVLVGVGLKATAMAEEVDKSFHLMAASIPETTQRMGDLREEAATLSTEFGLSQKEITEGMLALSRTGIDSVDELIAANRAAREASRATGDTFGTVVGVLDSALDGFNLNAKDSEAVLAKLFITAQGKTNLEELGQVFQVLGPTAVRSGIDLGTLTEAVVTLSTENINGKHAISVLTEAMETKGAPAIHKLAEASHVASDGIQEMRAQTDLMNGSLEVSQARLKEQLNAQLIDLGQSVLPLAVKGMQGLTALINELFGGSRNIEKNAAFLALHSMLGVLDKYPPSSNAAKQAMGELTETMLRATGGIGGLALSFHTLSTERLVDVKRGLEETIRAGLVTGDTLTQMRVAVVDVANEIAKRPKGILPPVPKETTDSIRKTTAALLEGGEAAKKAAADAKKAAEGQADSDQALLELQIETNGAMVTMEEAQRQAIVALEISFNERIAKLRGDAKDKGLALLAEAKTKMVGYWQAIHDATTPRIAEVADTTVELGGYTLDLSTKVTGAASAYEGLKRKLDDATEAEETQRQKIAGLAHDIAGAADVFGAMTEAMGLADDKSRELVNGIADIADAIGSIASGNVVGGLVQGISGLSGVIAGLFGGESASARAVRLELVRTQAELERHRQTLGDLIAVTQPGAKVAALGGAVTDFLQSDIVKKSPLVQTTGLLPDDAPLRKFLVSRGLSMDDLDQLAKDLGINLRPGGKAISIEQLQTLLQDLDTRDSGFAKTFEGQLDRLTQRWNIIGADTAQKLGDLVDLAGGELGSPALAGLKDFNLNTATGRAGAQDFLAALLDRGDLTNEDLGGLSLSKFRDLLGTLAGLLHDWGSQAESLQSDVDAAQAKVDTAKANIETARKTLDEAITRLDETMAKGPGKNEDPASFQQRLDAAMAAVASGRTDFASAQGALPALNDALAAALAKLPAGLHGDIPGPGVTPDYPPISAVVADWSDALAASAFPPSDEAASWERSIAQRQTQIDWLAQIAANTLMGTIQPPPLSVSGFPNMTTPGSNVVSITFAPGSIVLEGSGNPERDGDVFVRTLAEKLLPYIQAGLHGDLVNERLGQGNNARRWRR